MNVGIINTLLYQNESDALDFKAEQYRFYRAPDSEKGEVLKDILAFANAWKTCDAYILVGVAEGRGPRHEVIGISEHLQDSDLQQFVNSKTNRPVQFLVGALTIEGRRVDVIRIDQQQNRPIFLREDFGRLQKGTVYVRRGSSTDIAGPEEIAAMGAAGTKDHLACPTIELEFARPKHRKRLGREIEVTSRILIDSTPARNKPEGTESGGHLGLSASGILAMARHFEPSGEALRSFYEQAWLLTSLGFWTHNSAPVTATAMRVEITCETEEGVQILDEWTRPKEPRGILQRPILPISSNISVSKYDRSYLVEVEIGRLQPKAEYWTDAGLYVGARVPSVIDMVAKVFADNLPKPLEFPLRVTVRTDEKAYTRSA